MNVSFFTFLLQNITKDNIISNDNMERKADIVRELLANDIEEKIEKSSGRYTFYGADAQRTSDDCFRECCGEQHGDGPVCGDRGSAERDTE